MTEINLPPYKKRSFVDLFIKIGIRVVILGFTFLIGAVFGAVYLIMLYDKVR